MGLFQSSYLAAVEGHGKLSPNYIQSPRQSTRPGTFCMGLTKGCNNAPWTSKNAKIMWFLQDDIQVPCIMQCRLLWLCAQSDLNKVLIRVGALRPCHDKTIKKAMENVFTTLFGDVHTPRSVFLEAQRAMLVKYMQGWAWRPDTTWRGGVRVDDLICWSRVKVVI